MENIFLNNSDSQTYGQPNTSSMLVRVNVFLLSLTTPSGDRLGLPWVEWTLAQAERVHEQMVGRAAKGERIDCPELTGAVRLKSQL